jgi:hypothetical protein
MTAASEPDILAGVERSAKVLGIRAHHGNDAPRGWRITKASSNGGVLVMHQGATHHDPAPFWTVSPAIALAFCLLLASGAGPVDVGRCPVCDPTGYGYPVYSCEACDGTGRETIPVARLLLDAASGDPTALDRLHVHADQLQAASVHDWGELLAWALGPWSGEPVDSGPCDDDRCENGMTDSGGVTQWDTAAMVQCPACKGSARMLGHPHTAAALRWLEWLTWTREDAAPFEAARAAVVVATRGELEALARAAHRADRLIPDNLGIDLADRPQGRLPLTVPRW